MKTFWLLVLMALPASGATRLLSPKHSEHLTSLGTAMLKDPLVVQSTRYWLAWDYPSGQLTNVVFDVYHAYTLASTPPLTSGHQIPNNFTLMSTVDSTTQLSIAANQAAEFFIVRARDKISGVVSNWNVP